MMMRYNIRDVDYHGNDNLHFRYNFNYVILYFKMRVFNIMHLL